MNERHKPTSGFTLLELLMVVIIIAILASLALPQYFKTAERSRIAEALTILSQLRQAEQRYKAENGVFTSDVTVLDVDDPNPASNLFAYMGVGDGTCIDGAGTKFVLTAKRSATGLPGCTGNYIVALDQAGTRVGQNCDTTAIAPLTC